MSKSESHSHIVLVDDSDDDILLFHRGFKNAGFLNEIIFFSNAELFLDHMNLISEGQEPAPALVLLDVNLPGLSGHEALRRMRAIKEFEKVPAVVMVSHSKAKNDIEEAMKSGASGYLIKPATDEEWRTFHDFIRGHLRQSIDGIEKPSSV